MERTRNSINTFYFKSM